MSSKKKVEAKKVPKMDAKVLTVAFKKGTRKNKNLQKTARVFADAMRSIELKTTLIKRVRGKVHTIKVEGSHIAWPIKYFEIIE